MKEKRTLQPLNKRKVQLLIHTSVTASLAGFAISLTRHSAIGALCSFNIAAALWSNSALFQSGVLAHNFWATFADSMALLTSSCVQAVSHLE